MPLIGRRTVLLISLCMSAIGVRQRPNGMKLKIKPRHEISNNVVRFTSKVSNQPAHTRILIRAFASHLNIL